MTSRKVQSMDVSGVRNMFEMASKIKDPIDLTIGLPDFDVPDEIKDEAIKAIKQGKNRYTQTKGITELREKITAKLKKKNKILAGLEQISVTSAGSAGLSLVFATILDKDDEVIIFDPYFVAYKQLALLNEAKPIMVGLNEDFSINLDNLKTAITTKTKMIVINSPTNPTGQVYSSEELEEIAKIAKEHDLTIVSDEVYEDFVYDGEHISIGSIYEKTISIFGFSKSHAMTGWRVGYMCGPKEIIEEATKVSQFTFVCAPTPFQYASLLALDYDMSSLIKQYKDKRDFIYERLRENYKIIKPKGAFYAFIRYPYEADRFIKDCLDRKLLVVPGNVFSEQNTHFRVSFANDDQTLKQGIKILNDLASKKSL